MPTKLNILDQILGSGAGNTPAKGDVFVVIDSSGNLARVAAAAGVLTEDGSGNVTFAAPSTVPTGSILPFGGAAPPSGYLGCDGSAVSRATYAALFAVLGTSYGSGNGSTTFNVPDLRGRFPLGQATSGTGSTKGATGGALDHVHAGPSHTHTGPSHTHDMAAHTHDVNIAAFDSGTPSAGAVVQGGTPAAVAHTSHTHSIDPPNTTSSGPSTANTGASGTGATGADGTENTSAENPAFQVVGYIVKT